MLLERALDAYLRHVTVERGLSAHTIAAYRRDLGTYREWLVAEGIGDTAEVTPAVIDRFIGERASAEPPRPRRAWPDCSPRCEGGIASWRGRASRSMTRAPVSVRRRRRNGFPRR